MTNLGTPAEQDAQRQQHDQRRSPAHLDGYLPIGEYASIGDGHTLALVGSDGSIDWMCLPELDSPSVFGAIIGARSGGRFVLQPSVPHEVSRRYIERTNVLETTFSTSEGQVRITDALTIDNSQTAPWRELVRRVEGLAGSVPMRWSFDPRFEWGQVEPEYERFGDCIIARHGEMTLGLQAFDAGADETKRAGEFHSREGQTALLVMTGASGEPLPLPPRSSIERRLDETVEVWRSWVQRHTYEGQFTEQVERSLLAIRLLADHRTGAIAAAGTNSLPEVLGKQRNFDYRFGWVRDASFTLDALLDVGMDQLTHASLTWLLSAVGRTRPRVDPVYALNGEVVRSQQKLPLPGYRETGPVHLGNKAGSQLQLGGWGDLMETVYQYICRGHVLTPGIANQLADSVDLLCRIWRNQDAGLWELGTYADYGTSKVSCWLAFKRMIELAERGQAPARHVERWKSERDAARNFIEERLWSEEKRSYLQKAGSDALDCGMLLIGRRGYVDPTGERMNGTIDAIRRELAAEGPLLYRYSGMQDKENAFLACSFWMVEALALAKRTDEAGEMMEQLVGLANDVGLYSEEMKPSDHELRGNFPQALTHLSLINAAKALSQAR